jgi:predicted ATP-dependent serine protease
MEKRIAEATRLGYKRIFVPAGSQKETPSKAVTEVRMLRDLFEEVFG